MRAVIGVALASSLLGLRPVVVCLLLLMRELNLLVQFSLALRQVFLHIAQQTAAFILFAGLARVTAHLAHITITVIGKGIVCGKYC